MTTTNPTKEQLSQAVLLSPNLRSMIRQMHTRDDLPGEEIAEMLSIDPVLVCGYCAELDTRAAASPTNEDEGTAPERLLDAYKERAAEVMAALLEESSNPVIQLRASEYILDTAAKLKRPKKESREGDHLTQINVYLDKAAASYQAQLDKTKVVIPV